MRTIGSSYRLIRALSSLRLRWMNHFFCLYVTLSLKVASMVLVRLSYTRTEHTSILRECGGRRVYAAASFERCLGFKGFSRES